jgi:hypothetical protein
MIKNVIDETADPVKMKDKLGRTYYIYSGQSAKVLKAIRDGVAYKAKIKARNNKSEGN